MSRFVTLKDVAEAAGVNATTVSKALRGAGDLNPETARRVRETATALGYRARERKNGAQKLIGVVCPELMGSYYARIASTLYASLRAQGMDVLLSVSDFDASREEALLESFEERSLAGIICVTENDLSAALSRIPGNVPTVVIAANISSQACDVIRVDEHIGIRYVIEHLYALGHRDIVFAGTRYGEKRLHYVTRECQRLGIPFDGRHAFVAQERHAPGGYALAGRILAQFPRVTAVVAEYDDVALGVIRGLREAGVRVPEDISVTGYDDADFCAYLPVALTSVDSHGGELCDIAVETLLKKLQNPSYRIVQSITVRPTLVQRESTGNVSKNNMVL